MGEVIWREVDRRGEQGWTLNIVFWLRIKRLLVSFWAEYGWVVVELGHIIFTQIGDNFELEHIQSEGMEEHKGLWWFPQFLRGFWDKFCSPSFSTTGSCIVRWEEILHKLYHRLWRLSLAMIASSMDFRVILLGKLTKLLYIFWCLF